MGYPEQEIPEGWLDLYAWMRQFPWLMLEKGAENMIPTVPMTKEILSGIFISFHGYKNPL